MQPDIEIFLFIDALGWNLVSQTHFLESWLPKRRGIEMQFGYSCTAIPTILSGVQPDRHGHLSFYQFAPQCSPFKKLAGLETILKPASFWNRGRIRHWLSKLIKRLYGYTGYFQLYQMPWKKLAMMDYCEKRDLFAPHGLSPLENLRDMLDKTNVPFHISDWHLGDEANLEAGRQALRNGCRFLFLYTAELDGLLHDHIGDMTVIQRKLAWYATKVQALLETGRAMGRQIRMTVFSDHGMTPFTHAVDIQAAIEALGLCFGTDYGACYDSTMVRFTFLSPVTQNKIRSAMTAFEQLGHWLSLEEERRYGIYREDRLFGDAIFLMNPGIQVIPSDMGAKPLHGMHGFAPEDSHSQAAILSNDRIPDQISHVADYFSLMKERLDNLVGNSP